MYLSSQYALLYYGDSASHLFAARKLFDWQNPGLGQLGTVWLPLPHILFVLPTFSDFMFYSGLAGVAINGPALALTTVLLYKILLATGRVDRGLALLIALLYPLNPSILYLGVTAMTEVTFMLFFVASAFYFQKWGQSFKSSHLFLCSAFVATATLCRYEGWALVLIFIPSTLLISAVKGRLHYEKAVPVVTAAALSIFGIALWLGWNTYNYGDPLEFANAQHYSAAAQATERPVRGALYLQPLNVLGVYGITALVVYGPVLLVTGALGYIKKLRKNMLLYYLAAPAAFTLLSMISGVGEMSFWFNSRFIVFLAPAVLVSSLAYLKTLEYRRRLALMSIIFIHMIVVIPSLHSLTSFDQMVDFGLAALLPLEMKVGANDVRIDKQGFIAINDDKSGREYQYKIPSNVPLIGAVTLIDARTGFEFQDSKSAVEVGQFLKSEYGGEGKIMVIAGSAQGQRIMISSWIALANYDQVLESSMWKDSFKRPWEHDNRWIVIIKSPGSDALKPWQYWDANRDILEEKQYELVFEDQYYKVLRLDTTMVAK